MFLGTFHWRGRRRRAVLRAALLTIFIAFIYDITAVFTVAPLATRISLPMSNPYVPETARKERIFIASMHWNNEQILRSHWNAAIVRLVQHFGAENVYVSIQESGSWDDTKGALRELDLELGKLGVERSIELHDRTHHDEIEREPGEFEQGWIMTRRGKKELRRIPYLAQLRNRVMDKFYQASYGQANGKPPRLSFDKILWLNDVIFTTEDVISLIATREGKYAAACALDFAKPPFYYDTFALRDISGAKPISQTWPYFLASASRYAVIHSMPVPVKSCWNGIVVFQAEPFYNDPPPRFRGIPDSLALHHLEASECCLIHADNKLSDQLGVWLNPNVRVSYNLDADEIVNPQVSVWPSAFDRFKGIWDNRWMRWTRFPWSFWERRVVNWRVAKWMAEVSQESSRENIHGYEKICMINEMQVLVENGWAHV